MVSDDADSPFAPDNRLPADGRLAADTRIAADSRFAAVGLLGGPAGAVVLPGAPAGQDPEAEALLRAGRFDQLPPAWAFLADLARGEAPRNAISDLNRAILSGDAVAVQAHLHEAKARSDHALAALLSATAYRLGAEVESPEADPPQADPPEAGASMDARVRAYVLATAGHDAAAEGDALRAGALLRQAASLVEAASPAASARYLGEAAAVLAAIPSEQARIAFDLEQAADRLDGLGFEELRGEILMTRAGLLMDLGSQRMTEVQRATEPHRATEAQHTSDGQHTTEAELPSAEQRPSEPRRPTLLLEAVRCLQQATQALPRRTHPVAYAACHVNIAVAYLSMPMNRHASKLRGAIAVQSLREALEILTHADHPELWQAATLNLANALQHLPSGRREERLAESVRLYQQLLEHRGDPGVARARVLANLGNALAHLGRLNEAEPRLAEARTIFASHGCPDEIAGIEHVLAAIAQTASQPPPSGGAATPCEGDASLPPEDAAAPAPDVALSSRDTMLSAADAALSDGVATPSVEEAARP